MGPWRYRTSGYQGGHAHARAANWIVLTLGHCFGPASLHRASVGQEHQYWQCGLDAWTAHGTVHAGGVIGESANAVLLMHLSRTSLAFLLYLCLLKLSIHMIKTRAATKKDLVCYRCLCAVSDTCSFWASTMHRPRRASRCSLVGWVSAFGASGLTPCGSACLRYAVYKVHRQLWKGPI